MKNRYFSSDEILEVLNEVLPRFLTYAEVADKLPHRQRLKVYATCKVLRTNQTVDSIQLNGIWYIGMKVDT